MICRNGPCSNEGKRYIFGLGHTRQLTVLCDECAAALSSIGMSLRAEAPVLDTRPVWLRRLRAKDFSGSVIA